MKLTLEIWRQPNSKASGDFETYQLEDISDEMSFLEMLDVLNERLIKEDKDPVSFSHDCREGICGSCGLMINGRAHGPERGTATCQLHMRSFSDGDHVVVEPWRSVAFPVIKDLVVDRSSFDRIQQSGGYISINAGAAQDANNIPVPKENADEAFNAAACIGCGACVAACPNGAATLFTSSKISHLSLLPQGQPERNKRVIRMVQQMDTEGFGNCTQIGACEGECPKEISISHIARMNRQYMLAKLAGGKDEPVK